MRTHGDNGRWRKTQAKTQLTDEFKSVILRFCCYGQGGSPQLVTATRQILKQLFADNKTVSNNYFLFLYILCV